MKLDDWARAALADAATRGLPELPGIVEALVATARAIRAADWNDAADAELAAAGAPGAPPVRSAADAARHGGVDPAAAAGMQAAARVTYDAVPPASNNAVAPASRRGPETATAIPTTGNSHPLPPNLETIDALAPKLRSRALSSRALTEACLRAIAERADLNAFITVTADLARARADAADRELDAGRWRGPLHGIPLSLKDLIDVAGLPTTAGSRVRRDTVAARDAAVVARLSEAGAVLVGKCNLHEFAFGTTNEDSAFGPARHPSFPERSPGGSSGGSAAGVAAGLCVASIGTDTGGSIRIPSAACGLVGFKPPFGHVSCDGVVPLARTLDHVGPIARSVADAWHVAVALGATPARALDAPPSPRAVRGTRLGVPRRYFLDRLDTGVRDVFDRVEGRLREAGAATPTVDVPHAALVAPVYLVTVFAEAAAYHAATLHSRPDDYTPAVRVRLEAARYVDGEDYVRAQRGREVLRKEVDAALAGCEALILPTLPIPAPILGATSVDVGGTRDSVRGATLRLTQPFNLTGHPALSIPCGRTPEGLPVGLQIVAPHDRVVDLFALAAAMEDLVTRTA